MVVRRHRVSPAQCARTAQDKVSLNPLHFATRLFVVFRSSPSLSLFLNTLFSYVAYRSAPTNLLCSPHHHRLDNAAIMSSHRCHREQGRHAASSRNRPAAAQANNQAHAATSSPTIINYLRQRPERPRVRTGNGTHLGAKQADEAASEPSLPCWQGELTQRRPKRVVPAASTQRGPCCRSGWRGEHEQRAGEHDNPPGNSQNS